MKTYNVIFGTFYGTTSRTNFAVVEAENIQDALEKLDRENPLMIETPPPVIHELKTEREVKACMVMNPKMAQMFGNDPYEMYFGDNQDQFDSLLVRESGMLN